MAFKAIIAICTSALLVQGAFSQCAGLAGNWGLAGTAGWNGLAGPGLGLTGGYGVGCGCGGVASTGGGLPVSSASPCAPVGVSVQSENAYAGELAAGGNLPFLGTVGIEGVLPTAGAGFVSYGCGNGANGIVSEGPIGTGILAANNFAPSAGLAAPGIAGIGYNGLGYNGLGYNGLAGAGAIGYGPAGCGCGGIY